MLSRNRVAFINLLVAGTIQIVPAVAETAPQRLDRDVIAARLTAAYPDFIKGIEGNDVVFKDGTRLPFDDGRVKTFDQWLDEPDIEDMFRLSYPWGAAIAPPSTDFDPGRARNAAFFAKVYGDCRAPEFAKFLTTISWLPRKSGQNLEVTAINGVAQALKAVSDELDALPTRFDVFLVPSASTFNCRAIAGTARRSAHGYAIAIDIAVEHSNYWRWAKVGTKGEPVYQNAIPPEIVSAFEKHGFIWGGRWFHYDTMHFEYRPELREPEKKGNP